MLLELSLESSPENHFPSLLAVAAEKGHFEVARYLLIMGADVHGSVSSEVKQEIHSSIFCMLSFLPTEQNIQVRFPTNCPVINQGLQPAKDQIRSNHN